MPKPKVFVTRVIRDKGLDLVKEACQAEIWQEELPPTREVLLERVRGVDGLLCLLTDRIDAEVMDAAGPGLKVISNHAVGFDNVDVAAATARGIAVGNTPGILTDATADMAFALMMAAGRRVVEAEKFLRAGKWKTWGPSLLLGADFAGATLGIIGFGRIGQAVAKRATGFDMRILYYDPNVSFTASSAPGLPGPTGSAGAGDMPGKHGLLDPLDKAVSTDLDTLLAESDFVSIHVPLTPETRHLVDADFLSKMKPDAVLVNTARGGVLDQDALYETLKARRIFAAALDVTDPEPLPLDSPLLELDNCLIVPHIASASVQSRDMMALLSAQNLIAGLRGERLPHCVNPEVYAQASDERR
ncbi:MAG: 2-hydroxyacid dehydrogenase [Chloroflexota bacterium]